MYYLYHIPGKKIGVTTNLLKRVTKTQGYKSGEYEILLSSDDIDFISDQERELQKKFGYKVDIYWIHFGYISMDISWIYFHNILDILWIFIHGYFCVYPWIYYGYFVDTYPWILVSVSMDTFLDTLWIILAYRGYLVDT